MVGRPKTDGGSWQSSASKPLLGEESSEGELLNEKSDPVRGERLCASEPVEDKLSSVESSVEGVLVAGKGEKVLVRDEESCKKERATQPRLARRSSALVIKSMWKVADNTFPSSTEASFSDLHVCKPERLKRTSDGFSKDPASGESSKEPLFSKSILEQSGPSRGSIEMGRDEDERAIRAEDSEE